MAKTVLSALSQNCKTGSGPYGRIVIEYYRVLFAPEFSSIMNAVWIGWPDLAIEKTSFAPTKWLKLNSGKPH